MTRYLALLITALAATFVTPALAGEDDERVRRIACSYLLEGQIRYSEVMREDGSSFLEYFPYAIVRSDIQFSRVAKVGIEREIYGNLRGLNTLVVNEEPTLMMFKRVWVRTDEFLPANEYEENNRYEVPGVSNPLELLPREAQAQLFNALSNVLEGDFEEDPKLNKAFEELRTRVANTKYALNRSAPIRQQPPYLSEKVVDGIMGVDGKPPREHDRSGAEAIATVILSDHYSLDAPFERLWELYQRDVNDYKHLNPQVRKERHILDAFWEHYFPHKRPVTLSEVLNALDRHVILVPQFRLDRHTN